MLKPIFKQTVFVALHGVDNTTNTLANLLKDKCQKEKFGVHGVKYPNYHLEPTGPRLHNYLQRGNPEKLSPWQFQELSAQNRRDYNSTMRSFYFRSSLDILIAENYTATSIALGLAYGFSKEKLLDLNQELLPEDIGILFDSQTKSNDPLCERVRQNFIDLASLENNWKILSANDSLDTISEKVFKIICDYWDNKNNKKKVLAL